MRMSPHPTGQPPVADRREPVIGYASLGTGQSGRGASSLLAVASLLFTGMTWLLILLLANGWLLYGQDQMRTRVLLAVPAAAVVAIILALPAQVMSQRKLGLSLLALVTASATGLLLVAIVLYAISHMPG
jgi:hypothetical protein